MMLNSDVIEKIITIYNEKGDKEAIEMLSDCFTAFISYHSAIYSMETTLKFRNISNTEPEEYKDIFEGLDKKRTMAHNRVIVSIKIMNRMAAAENLAPVYDGIVSEEYPYRRQIGDAVMEYIEDIIKKRR